MLVAKFIILGFGLLALCMIILASITNNGRVWKRCLKCNRHFNDLGEVSRSPLVIPTYDCNEQPVVGVCDECRDDLDFGKE